MNNLELFQMVLIIISISFSIGSYVGYRMNRRKLQKIPDIYKKIDQWTINQHEVLQRQSSLTIELQVLREAQDRMLRTVAELSAWKSGTQETVVRHENLLKELPHISREPIKMTYDPCWHTDVYKKALDREWNKIFAEKQNEVQDFRHKTDIIFGEPKCNQCEKNDILPGFYLELVKRIVAVEKTDYLRRGSKSIILSHLNELRTYIDERIQKNP